MIKIEIFLNLETELKALTILFYYNNQDFKIKIIQAIISY